MESNLTTKKLRIGGMTCVNCQNKIERKLRDTAGIESANVSYNAGTAVIIYDTDMISLSDITATIRKLDYEVLTGEPQKTESSASRDIGAILIIVALYIIMRQFGLTQIFSNFQLAEAGMGYGMLFIIGLVTSVHCVAMCGGINISQCIPASASDTGGGKMAALRPTFLYNFGRVISYTVVGGIVGALGSVFSLSGGLKGIVQIIAGVFMVIMGVNMLGIFPWLRRFTPRMPRLFANRIDAEKGKSKSPLYIGLLNGLMPCGPLQAMQLYALSTESPIAGALSMMLFSLGTVPLMFGLGAISYILSKRFTNKMMTVGAILVAVLGLSMFSQGLSLSGFSGLPFTSPSVAADSAAAPGIVIEDSFQIIKSTLESGRYPAITVQAGIPVRWTIDAPQGSINGCNNRMFIPEYDIEHKFQTGENVIEFTPAKVGKFQYSCWMGMIRSTITVVEDGAEIGTAAGNDDYENDDNGRIFGTEPDIGVITPSPANIIIPTEEIALAEMTSENGYEYQQVTTRLTDEGFSPAVLVVQEGFETAWVIDNSSTKTGNSTLLVPIYNTQIPLTTTENGFSLFPTESFEFSNGDNTFYGYIKVVDDIDSIDVGAIKEEARDFETVIWPPEYFQSSGGGGGASCH